jgi:hypothetical protein
MKSVTLRLVETMMKGLGFASRASGLEQLPRAARDPV